MLIQEIFSRAIERDIKEVIKVDDRQSVLEEVEEYVPTDHITNELVDTLEKYQDTINNPSEEINIWISGFFGSGKSSFAKMLGYLLANPSIGGVSVAERFFELNEIPQAKALLTSIHSGAPTETVLLDLNTTPNLLQEGEPIVLPVYRTLLAEFDYSRDIVLAELEFELEDPKGGDTTLTQFTQKYQEVFDTSWESQRDVITAKNRASRVLHELDPKTYPSADSWSNAAQPPLITAKWFSQRALALLGRRRPDKKRLVLVVDEVGQYVSRSTDRMRHLQGLAEECQKTKGTLWLVATSQEKLTDVVDSLEGKQTELAKAQDRFPIRVDLLPSDIDEVTGRRVLDKTAAGATKVHELLAADRNKLTTSVRLQSDRHGSFTDDDFVRLYPLVPYQLQVLIDAVSARRAQGGAPQTMGGSNRTLIRHANKLLSNDTVGLAAEPVGALVTMDRSYVLLEDVIPTAWRHEVDQVVAKHGDDSLEAKIMRVVALCADIPGVPLTPKNFAVLLHPSIDADPIEADVRAALDHLVAEDRIRETDDGYRLQSPEQKGWEKTRRGIEMKPGDAVRHRKRILKDALGSITVSKGRTFKIELFAEQEKMSDGDIALDIRDEADIDGLRQTSRSEDGKHRIFWAYTTADDTWDALSELHRSSEMIDRYDNASQNDAQRVLLAEERKRRDRALKTAEQLLGRDITAGTVIFDGNTDDAPNGDLRPATDRLVLGLLGKIYPNLDTFAGTFKKTDVLQILQADTLDGIPDLFGPTGLGLFRITAVGRELVTDSGPVETVTSYIRARRQFGEDQNGGQLERHFGGPPFGAPVEALQAVLAAAMRAGLVEVHSQAARITSATDKRLEQVFGNLPKFRAASFRPAEDTGPSLEVRAEVSEWLSVVTGDPLSLDLHELAQAGRRTFGPLQQPCTEARATLAGANLAVPEVLTTMNELLGRVMSSDDELVVSTLHERRTDLDVGRRAVAEIAQVVEEQMDTLRAALRTVRSADDLTDANALEWAVEMQELLDRARYREDLARIKSLTTTIEAASTTEEEAIRSEITSKIETTTQALRSRYPKVDDSTFDDAVGALRKLADAADLALLRANAQAVAGAAEQAANTLDALSTTREIRHIRVAEIWGAAITSVPELDTALARLRDAVLAQLDDDTEIRFR
jgi:hypothetical protein